MSTSANDIPILKRLTTLEPEMELPAPTESVERQAATGVEHDDAIDSGAEADVDTESEVELPEEIPTGEILNKTVGLEMPVWIWISVCVLWLAYMWGIVYALSPIRTVYP